MRKILLVVLIVSIFSFSIVYAQEIYGMDGRDDQKTQQAMSREDTLEEDKKEEKETDVSDLEEAAQDKEVNTSSISESEDGGQAVSDNRDNQENTNKSTNNDTAKVKTSKKTNDVVSNSKQKSPEAKNTKNIEVKKKESANEAPKPKNTANSTTEVDGSPVIDTKNAKKGSFRAKYLSDSKLKVMVEKGGERYTYDLKGDNSYQSYPLQLGDGTYKISIMENIGGKQYKYVLSKEVEIKSSNPNDKYLTSVQMINWNTSMAPIKKAKSLAGGGSDKQKVSKIYNYIVNNIRYDSSITSLPSGYIPSLNKTYSSKKGICYDFASLFAGMLRSVGVPTKLVKGQSSNVKGYHAWNEVYVDGSWHIVDTSYDSQLKEAGHKYSMFKSAKAYSKSKEY